MGSLTLNPIAPLVPYPQPGKRPYRKSLEHSLRGGEKGGSGEEASSGVWALSQSVSGHIRAAGEFSRPPVCWAWLHGPTDYKNGGQSCRKPHQGFTHASLQVGSHSCSAFVEEGGTRGSRWRASPCQAVRLQW